MDEIEVSPFNHALVSNLGSEKMGIFDLFVKVREDTLNNSKQSPWIVMNMGEPIYFDYPESPITR